MAKKRYAMIIEESLDKNTTRYGAWFPDLPGCFTVGDSLEQLQQMAEEAVALYLWALDKSSDPIPEPLHQVGYVAVDPAKAIATLGGHARPSAERQGNRIRSVGAARNTHSGQQIPAGKTAAGRGKSAARASG